MLLNRATFWPHFKIFHQPISHLAHCYCILPYSTSQITWSRKMLRKLFDHPTITILLPTKLRIYVRIGLSRYQLILTRVPFITALRVLDPWHLRLRIWLPGLWASLVNRLKWIGDESTASPPIHALQRFCCGEFLLLTIDYNLGKALFVPCDSHGFQRLIKDVRGIPHYKGIQFQIMLVINTFRRSPLRLLILREKPKPCYGKTSALVLAVIIY